MSSNARSDTSVGKSIARGAFWTVSMRLVNRSLGIVSTLVLARLLAPSDFGIYALAMTVYGFVELMRAFGFGSYLIQHQDTTDDHYHTAWTLHLVFSLATASLLYFIAPVAADFLREPGLIPAMRFLCLVLLLDGVKNVAIINFQKHMTFHLEFRFALTTKLTGFAVTVPLAFLLKSYWAMLWGLLATSLMMVFLSYRMQPFRPRPGLSCWREMISFSSWLQVNNIVNYFNRHAENILISRMLGVAAVGSLQIGREVGQILGELTRPVNRAAFAGFARVNREPSQLAAVFTDLLAMLMAIGFPVAVGLAAVAHLFVPTVLGPKWEHIVPLVKWLSLASLLLVILSCTNNALISLARMKWATGLFTLRLLLLVAFLVYLLPRYGIMGAAYASMATLSIAVAGCFLALRINLELSLSRIVGTLHRPAMAALLMFSLVQLTFPEHWSDRAWAHQLWQLIMAVTLGAACYCLTLLALWWLQARPAGPELQVARVIHARTGWLGFLLPGGRQNA